ncbi:DUF4148 domain-containing protein [Achromobacter xylosoxidans]|uniref:DUF4148 domain-containing protein n=1 Tax=Alcaligenes xylosoxydans xylosoxydans TaxID=85698 RepID=UPI0006C2F317|nr:DUF4148 domain-containing protein [Achromobacter xylosoxidans]MDH0519159.1 DUF4148 domain-containing protein [Achromobacter xylosoxidans]MDH0543390.1 DUF4148 domain-containing protein [Achromobacter xylosoxidans]CUI94288.1 Uncharacterised protein [Achromobacter xylosoxidans]
MKTLVSALILSASFIGAAQAGELDYPPALDTHSTVTRAQVQQELVAARANGELVSTEEGSAATAFASAGDKSRAQVKQELAAARAQGLTDSGELDYPPVQG